MSVIIVTYLTCPNGIFWSEEMTHSNSGAVGQSDVSFSHKEIELCKDCRVGCFFKCALFNRQVKFPSLKSRLYMTALNFFVFTDIFHSFMKTRICPYTSQNR